ncbi:hypothetical protein [uncultured Abyssibacter sp.]|uniref:hypothetical protein n=1 Tax=uncultured Abyssibacter sp. TaxID=2320202 RepID=UPI0032B13D37
MGTRLFLNDANTIFAIDASGPDHCPRSSLLRPLLKGAPVHQEAVQTLLQAYGGTWVTTRGIKRYPRRDTPSSADALERHAESLRAESAPA